MTKVIFNWLSVLNIMLSTVLVWVNVCVRRIVAVKVGGIRNAPIPNAGKFNAVLSDHARAPANCYRNLFEVPVIFYALTTFVMLESAAEAVFINMALAIVALRAVQACVQCTYSRVMHRFYAYFASSLVLWIIVIRFFLTIF